jgi:hypothetical protein
MYRIVGRVVPTRGSATHGEILGVEVADKCMLCEPEEPFVD